MTLTGYLLLSGALLMLIDIFFHTDIPTYLAYLLFSYAFFSQLQFNILVNIIVTILFFFLLLLFHNFIWNNTVQWILDKFFSKDRYLAGVDGLAGSKGTVKVIRGKKLANIHNDLYKFLEENSLEEGDSFTVKEVIDGEIVIE